MHGLEGQVMEHGALAGPALDPCRAARAAVLRNLELSSSGGSGNGLTVYDTREATKMDSLAR